MTPAERIAAIQESATLFSQQTWTDVDLILAQHDIVTRDNWEGSRYDYIINTLKYEPSDRLQALHQYLTSESNDIPAGPQPWGQGQLKLFMSHLAIHQQFVGE